jgi:hypothetical protein
VATLVAGTDYQTLEDLNTLLVTFADFLVHFNGVTATNVDNS